MIIRMTSLPLLATWMHASPVIKTKVILYITQPVNVIVEPQASKEDTLDCFQCEYANHF